MTNADTEPTAAENKSETWLPPRGRLALGEFATFSDAVLNNVGIVPTEEAGTDRVIHGCNLTHCDLRYLTWDHLRMCRIIDSVLPGGEHYPDGPGPNECYIQRAQ